MRNDDGLKRDAREPSAEAAFSGDRPTMAPGDALRRLDDITRLVSDWVWETDDTLKLTYLSFRIFEVLGFHSLELMGRRLSDLGTFMAEDGTPIGINWQTPFRDVAFEMADRDGNRKYFLVSGLPVYSTETGVFTGVRGTARDITPRRRAEMALRDSEQRLLAVIGNLPVVLFSLDAAGVFTLCEGKEPEALGLKSEQVIGKSAFDIYAGYPGLVADIRRALAGEAVVSPLQIDDRSFECAFSPVRNDTAVTGVIGVAINITRRARAQKELHESEERFRNLIEGSLLGIVIHRAGKPIFANQAYATIFGYDTPEEILRLPLLDPLCHLDDRQRFVRYRLDQMQGRPSPARYEFQGCRRDGTRILVEAQVRVVTWKGKPAVQSTIIDVTEHRRTVENLRKLSQAVEQSPASVIITDTTGAIEYVNPKFVEVSGYALEDVSGKNPRILKSGKTPEDVYDALWQTITAGQEWRGEMMNRKKNGDLYWESVSISPIKTQNGAITHFLAVKEDISLRKEYEKRLIQQANFDEVTGLPNRVLALDRLEQALARGLRQNHKVGLLFIDLDRFKYVNDTLGHHTGDHILKEAGARIRHCLRAADTVARLGGDEFTVIVPDLQVGIDVEPVAQKILESFGQPFHLGGREIFLTPSIGITIWPDDGGFPDELMRNADTAMYRAKEMGRNNFRFFTPELNERALARARMEHQIRHALERNEFDLHYQPLIDLATGRIVRAEALLRWCNPELGQVSPDEFIPLAEEIGLITPIGEWVLRTACRQAMVWRREGLCPERISVNVSSRQFRGLSLFDTVVGILEETGMPPTGLELEITENLLMADIPEVVDSLRRLDDLGISLSVDDFGTGYSSLSYLRRFPVSVLKIDKSFVKDVATDSDNATLVEAIITMGRSLKLEVVAEGVETGAQMGFLRQRGCDYAQGYYYSRPAPTADFRRLMQDWRPSPLVDGLAESDT
ncbi:EAL domain-containing protein [Shumkonia mesophila]|uniref:EAL domain-containing protein n=1 Tax=Shumkonia mesophila TaxID=2838854 RepID=UPI002934F22E|nr:EAL domain-containing protein [Shumkonia mesophila]